MIHRSTFLLIFLFTALSSFAQKKIRIACIGNSITYGAGIVNRENNNYPQQLQAMLGNTYEVMNFGVNGTTLLKNGNKPYWKTSQYTAALASKPDIVFIKLGTNDSKAVNRPFYPEFENDYTALITSFRKLATKPRIVLLLPVPSFSPDSNQIYDPIIKGRIIPMIRKVAYETHTEVINLYPLFIDKADMFPDKIHPSSIGANVIARRLYEVVKINKDKLFDIFSTIKENKKRSSFYGFECVDFTLNNHSCKIVKPKIAVKGKPWIWRARFWGHEPQTDIALLERGYHIVFCDVAELFGNSEAVSVWNKFYDYLQQRGLSKRAVLEGMSRGGIYIYNWALANPGKVACIYADAPVLDLKSWPGGKGKGPGSKSDWEIFRKDYNLTEEQAAQFKNNPLDNAAKIAQLGFPMLHVVGDNDEAVPVDENTNPFEEKVKAAGGNIVVIHKPEGKHHPHSLPNPTIIADFILQATGNKFNFAAIAAPGVEYRSGAGWTEGKDWWAQFRNIDSLLDARKNLDILFLGNSITQGTGGTRTYVTSKPAFAIFDSVFAGRSWECAGISGDRTQNILWRLQHGNYAKAKPKVMVITIGVNNFGDDSAEEIAAGILAIEKWTKANMPSTKIILTGPLPTSLKKDTDRRRKYERIHDILLASKTAASYFPLSNTFIRENGDIIPGTYSNDGIHLAKDGYRLWALALKPVIDNLL